MTLYALSIIFQTLLVVQSSYFNGARVLRSTLLCCVMSNERAKNNRQLTASVPQVGFTMDTMIIRRFCHHARGFCFVTEGVDKCFLLCMTHSRPLVRQEKYFRHSLTHARYAGWQIGQQQRYSTLVCFGLASERNIPPLYGKYYS